MTEVPLQTISENINSNSTSLEFLCLIWNSEIIIFLNEHVTDIKSE